MVFVVLCYYFWVILMFEKKKGEGVEGGWLSRQKNPYHFGQVHFNMSSVIRVVFFTSKIRTI